MHEISLIPSDVQELARRRALAAARLTRENERTELLRKLVRMEREAEQLRGWIAQRQADQLRGWTAHRQAEVSASPEIQRMVDWAKAELAGLEAFLDPLKLSQLLIALIYFRKLTISSIRSASHHPGVNGVNDTEEYGDTRYHGRQHRRRVLAFTLIGRRCRRAASSSPFTFDAARCGTLRHGRGRSRRLSQFMRRCANTDFTKRGRGISRTFAAGH
jgi:hypothetical protein